MSEQSMRYLKQECFWQRENMGTDPEMGHCLKVFTEEQGDQCGFV